MFSIRECFCCGKPLQESSDDLVICYVIHSKQRFFFWADNKAIEFRTVTGLSHFVGKRQPGNHYAHFHIKDGGAEKLAFHRVCMPDFRPHEHQAKIMTEETIQELLSRGYR